MHRSLFFVSLASMSRWAMGASSSTRSSASSVITSAPTLPKNNNSCAANCTLYDYTSKWYWLKMNINTTIEAATVLYIVNDATNTTKTSTIYNDLPSGYTLPPTNSDGTQVQSFSWTDVEGKIQTTTMAFPTVFDANPHGYYWAGTLSTTASAGQSICASAAKKSASFVSYNSYSTAPQRTPDPSQIGGNGLTYTTYHDILAGLGPASKPNPSDAAIISCIRNVAPAPAGALTTAAFLTVTSTMHEKSAPTSTSGDKAPAKVHNEVTKTELSVPTSPAGSRTTPVAVTQKEPATQNKPASKNEPATQNKPVAQNDASTQKQPATQNKSAAQDQPATQNKPATKDQPATQTKPAISNEPTTRLNDQTKLQPSPSAQLLTLDDKTYTISDNRIAISGQTIAPDHPITLGSGSSTTVVRFTSDSSGNTVLVVGTSASTMSAAETAPSPSTTSDTQNVGGLINSGLGGSSTGSASIAVATTSQGSRGNSVSLLCLLMLGAYFLI